MSNHRAGPGKNGKAHTVTGRLCRECGAPSGRKHTCPKCAGSLPSTNGDKNARGLRSNSHIDKYAMKKGSR